MSERVVTPDQKEKPMQAMAVLIDRETRPENGWRHTTYERLDGSRFHVSLPRVVKTLGGDPNGSFYDDAGEAEMVGRLVGERCGVVVRHNDRCGYPKGRCPHHTADV